MLSLPHLVAAALVLSPVAGLAAGPSWNEQRDQLADRLRRLSSRENAFGAAYTPIYHAALPWYEQWGGRTPHDVDDWMVPPATYAMELADALEHGRNYFAEYPQGLIPLVFSVTLADGRHVTANYWLALPTGFGEPGRTFPLVIGLHGSGWLAHPISFVRQPHRTVPVRRVFSVTPIDEAGPWRIDFLNAYLDELLRILPIDAERVYVEGHSLGGMATWEWALDNPERFAAISPRAGRGEPFRAVRLKYVPAWPIHGEQDDVVPSGYADQMVSAMQACGAPVRYSVLRGVEHNMPEDLDEERVLDWYLQQKRAVLPPPPDPLAKLGLNPNGFSAWSVIADSARRYWVSTPVPANDENARRRAMVAVFAKPHAVGALADALVEEVHHGGRWVARLPVPASLRADAPAPADSIAIPATRYLRFYLRGAPDLGLQHAAAVVREAAAGGQRASGDTVIVIPLTLWPDQPGFVAEYRIPLE